MGNHRKRKATQIKATREESRITKVSKKNTPLAIEVSEGGWLVAEDSEEARGSLLVEIPKLRALESVIDRVTKM
jgi:hypothetical protein